MPRAATKIESTEERRTVQCQPGRLKLSAHAFNSWSINAPVGATPEDVAKSDFWSLMNKIRPFDEFRVVADDGTWMVKGIIHSCGTTWAKVEITDTIQLGEMVAPGTSTKYEAKWRGPEHLWSVVRTADGTVLQDKLDTQSAANKWLNEHEAKVG